MISGGRKRTNSAGNGERRSFSFPVGAGGAGSGGSGVDGTSRGGCGVRSGAVIRGRRQGRDIPGVSGEKGRGGRRRRHGQGLWWWRRRRRKRSTMESQLMVRVVGRRRRRRDRSGVAVAVELVGVLVGGSRVERRVEGVVGVEGRRTASDGGVFAQRKRLRHRREGRTFLRGISEKKKCPFFLLIS